MRQWLQIKWTTREGVEMTYDQMTSSHLRNARNMLLREAAHYKMMAHSTYGLSPSDSDIDFINTERMFLLEKEEQLNHRTSIMMFVIEHKEGIKTFPEEFVLNGDMAQQFIDEQDEIWWGENNFYHND